MVLWNAYDLRLCRSGECDVTDEQVRSFYFMDSSGDDLENCISMRVLRLGLRPIGSLVVCGHSLDAGYRQCCCVTCGGGDREGTLLRHGNQRGGSTASEQLRAAVLDGLAHAFKSPLTTIRSSSSGLLAMNTLSGAEKRLVALIDQHAAQLTDLSARLLRTARLDSGELRLRRSSRSHRAYRMLRRSICS